jgi:hypothetical protein
VHDTPAEPRGPWALPGDYTVRLGVGGRTLERPLRVTQDPRVRTSRADLERQFALATRMADLLRRDSLDDERVRAVRSRLGPRGRRPEADSLDAEALRIAGERGPGRGFGGAGEAPTLGRLSGEIVRAYQEVEASEAAPTPALEAACARIERDLDQLHSRVERLEARGRALPGAGR